MCRRPGCWRRYRRCWRWDCCGTARSDDARALLRQVLTSAADLCPDPAAKTLTVRLHRLSSGIHDVALEHLCAELTATETVFPGTDLRLIYEPVGFIPIPRDQES